MPTWKPRTTSLPTVTVPPVLRPWQQRCVDECRRDSHVGVNAPTGSGKSLLVKALSMMKMRDDPSLRTIVMTPQTIIGMGFGAEKFKFRDESESEWVPYRQLCDDYPDKVNELLSFLRDRPEPPIIVCSYTTALLAFKKCKKSERKALFSDLLVWFDEAHHSQMAETDVPNMLLMNKCGKFIDFLLGEGDNTHVSMVTATWFRGDQLSMLSGEQAKYLKLFRYGYDEYIENDTEIEKYDREFLQFDGLDIMPTLIPLIGRMIKERKKTIICVPHTQSIWSGFGTTKQSFVKKIIDAIHDEFGGQRIDDPLGFIEFRDEGNKLRVIDLVDDDSIKARNDSKAYLFNNAKKKDAIDVVVAMEMMNEGADWPWAEEVIIIGMRKSLKTNQQLVGRLMRHVDGKKIHQGMATPPDIQDDGPEEAKAGTQ